MNRFDFEYGPDEVPDAWEIQVAADYDEYKEKVCYCHDDLDCPCLSFEDFRLVKLDEKMSQFDEFPEDNYETA